jgi:hypothetical protein
VNLGYLCMFTTAELYERAKLWCFKNSIEISCRDRYMEIVFANKNDAERMMREAP